jgi:hypothetical protein
MDKNLFQSAVNNIYQIFKTFNKPGKISNGLHT